MSEFFEAIWHGEGIGDGADLEEAQSTLWPRHGAMGSLRNPPELDDAEGAAGTDGHHTAE